MVSPSSFVVLLCGLTLCSAQSGSGASSKPECVDENRDYVFCLSKNEPSPPSVDIDALNADSGMCFKDSGCPPRTAPNQNGPPPGAPTHGFNDTCFQNLHQKVYSQFERCLKEKDPNYGNYGPIPVVYTDDPRPGGSGGPSRIPPSRGPPPARIPSGILAQMCGTDNANLKQLETCMKNAYDKNMPTKEETKKYFDGRCAAKQTCKPKLGKCEEVLDKRSQLVCHCLEQAHAMADEIFKQEPACSGKHKPWVPGPLAGGKPECSNYYPDPCDVGFEKFYARLSQSGPPPLGAP